MRAAVEISMYPLTGEYRPPIQAFIDRLNTHPGLDRADQCTEPRRSGVRSIESWRF